MIYTGYHMENFGVQNNTKYFNMEGAIDFEF